MNSGGPPPLALPAVVSRRKQLAPAVAAASLVLGLGGLGFGLAANLRADSIEERLSTVEKSQQTAGVVEAASSPASTALSAENADAARTEIRTAFANVYTGVLPIEERLAYIDDPSGIGPVLSALSTGPAAPLALSSRVAVDRITFESANDATVRYTVTIYGSPPAAGRQGLATRVDGAWKVSRATVCADLAGLGFGCT
jgi:hypothetical protein